MRLCHTSYGFSLSSCISISQTPSFPTQLTSCTNQDERGYVLLTKNLKISVAKQQVLIHVCYTTSRGTRVLCSTFSSFERRSSLSFCSHKIIIFSIIIIAYTYSRKKNSPGVKKFMLVLDLPLNNCVILY